eukprot:336485-Amphidinium_carterae.1
MAEGGQPSRPDEDSLREDAAETKVSRSCALAGQLKGAQALSGFQVGTWGVGTSDVPDMSDGACVC